MVALASTGQIQAVADAVEAAGGRSIVTGTGAPGVRIEDESVWTSLIE